MHDGTMPHRTRPPATRPVRYAEVAIEWYAEHARDLPWRHADTTPWGVLVSEVMLQQTPVVRVTPAWREWMARWPAPADLAVEPAGDAIRAWGRLGYPRRALRLHACAVALVERHGGEVPDRLTDLLALPGVGAYTARAVAAFAFGQRHPVVDTNVRRLVARAVSGVPDGGMATTPSDLDATEALLPAEPARAAAASAAFMELGAVCCTARAPECARCPLADLCRWRAEAGGVTPRLAGPSRRPQGYAGTDRQVRGLIMAVVRDAPAEVPVAVLDAVWPDADQRGRALAGLVADGLLREIGHGHVALP
jgi:A/G-specific adenine glycosylase